LDHAPAGARTTPAPRAKNHPDRAKRIDSATSDAAEGAPKIARAKCPTNPEGPKKNASEGPRIASQPEEVENRTETVGFACIGWIWNRIWQERLSKCSGDS